MACVSFARFLAEQVTGKLNSNFYSKGLIFLFTIYGGKREFAQWDLDHLVTCPCMQKGDKVFFYANGKNRSTTAYERDGEIVADVPNALLQLPGSIRIDLGSGLECHIDCRTEINITEREKPDGYCCTDNSNLTKKYITSMPQNLTEAEKAQARENIGVAAGGGGGKSVQTDWDQMDEVAADFLKNKPFGDELVELMPETEIVGQLMDGQYGAMIDPSLFIGDISAILVTFDGIDYECDVNESFGIATFGNISVIDPDFGDTGEPFIIIPAMEAMVIADGDPHIISIANVKTDKISEKYVDRCKTLYVTKGDVYLYKDKLCTEKLTKTEFMDYANKFPLLIAHVLVGDGYAPLVVEIYACLAASFINTYGVILTGTNQLVQNGEFFTAEYTPET